MKIDVESSVRILAGNGPREAAARSRTTLLWSSPVDLPVRCPNVPRNVQSVSGRKVGRNGRAFEHPSYRQLIQSEATTISDEVPGRNQPVPSRPRLPLLIARNKQIRNVTVLQQAEHCGSVGICIGLRSLACSARITTAIERRILNSAVFSTGYLRNFPSAVHIGLVVTFAAHSGGNLQICRTHLSNIHSNNRT